MTHISMNHAGKSLSPYDPKSHVDERRRFPPHVIPAPTKVIMMIARIFRKIFIEECIIKYEIIWVQ